MNEPNKPDRSLPAEEQRDMTPAEIEEHERLEDFQRRVRQAVQQIDARLHDYAQEVQTRKEYLWDARRDMDHIEKIAVRQTIEQTMGSADVLKEQRNKLLKLMRSPYFGRFDFVRSGEESAEPVYVGVHHFRDEQAKETLVYDWRAPIASMFYDHEVGPASYQAPGGEIAGELLRKRQFRISEGRMEFMLETSVHIVDDVLQQELSRSADDGMKNIVASIQRDQNAIIRNEEAHTIVIQGVAGSGKTSIALHRIAFLLYRFKETLSSDDILIISPNRVFADYIGNVLPELGEEQVSEIGMETLAAELLDHEYRFQTFFEQTAQLLEKDDDALKARIAAKATPEFLRQIDAYVEHYEAESFVAAEWKLSRGRIVPDWFFEETWRKQRRLSVTERVNRVLQAAEQQIAFHYRYELQPEDRRALREAVRAMVRRTTLRQAYKNLFEWMGRPELFKPSGGKLEYADVFPLIYLKMRLEGVTNPRKAVKHLLIDEMQDYTPVQYAVLNRLFTCRKTVLGDATQSVNPYSASSTEQIQRALQSATCVKLTKSYRSTWEIMQFALQISPNPELIPMERHGEPPQVIACKRTSEELARIAVVIEEFLASPHQTLAVIAKTQKRARKLHKALVAAGIGARLLDADSAGFSTGVTVCTAHLAKGLEFDRVIVPDASDRVYNTEMDRNLLYVACTRAMHRLTLTFVGEPSRFVPSGRHEPNTGTERGG